VEYERALQTLEEFEKGDQFDTILQDPLTKLRNRIVSEVDFIRHKEHGIAFIGEIGVGKTTALSFVTNLITSSKDEEPKSIFPIGSGRTTVDLPGGEGLHVGQANFRRRDDGFVSIAAILMRLLASTAAPTHNSKRSGPSARQRFMPRPRNRTEMLGLSTE
jgi:hypothetical protein